MVPHTITKTVLFSLLLFVTNSCDCQKTNDDNYHNQRKQMVNEQIKERGIETNEILEAFKTVPRHLFVPIEIRNRAYGDYPLPIGYGQTISQPYIVAYMTEVLQPNKHMKVLEVGTGSGYQAAILSVLCKEVYTIEIVDSLAVRAVKVFDQLGYQNIKTKIGDGYKGWAEYAPFDAIIVTCAPTDIPVPLLEQLAEGGKMIIPAGQREGQVLYLIEKKNGEIISQGTIPVLFVPMVNEEGKLY